MPITLPALFTDRRIMLRCSIIHRTVVHNRLAHSATDRSPPRICRPTATHVTFAISARDTHTHEFHSCCFVDYVFQRKSPRRWAWRCRRKQLTHVQRISLAGVVSRATCIGAGRAANRAALCVCIDWGCICKGRVVWPRSGKRDLFRAARLSNMGCVAVPRGHVGSCKEELTCTIVSNWRFWAGLFLKWVC
jgi:hypothetical protein